MKKLIAFLSFFGAAQMVAAQSTTTLYEVYFSNPDKMIESDEGGYYFEVTGGNKVIMSDDGYYKLLNRAGTILEEGDTEEEEEQYLRHGRWKHYGPDGTLLSEGTYFKGKPVGQWRMYGAGGRLQQEYNIAVIQCADGSSVYCKSGGEYFYHENGKLKEERYYKAEPVEQKETVWVEDPETEQKVSQTITVPSYKPVPFGTWIYYNVEGEIIKREDKK
jgi:antitoxin component YwqK of YwqJK toxin-antitoxin module